MKHLLKHRFSQFQNHWMITVLIVLILSFIIGCTTNDDPPSAPSDESITAFDLLPVAVGNYWYIEGNQDGIVKGYETREIIKDTVILDRQCFVMNIIWDNLDPEGRFEHSRFISPGDSNYYWTRNIDDRWFEFSEFKNFPTASIGDTIHIDENIDADYMERRVYTVYDKNVTKTVKAGTFENCYVVKYDVKFTFDGELDRHEIYIDYYAPGVGFIWERDSCYYSNGESEIWIWDLLSYNVIL